MNARVCCVFALAAGLSCSALLGTAAADDQWCGEAAWFDGGGLTASGEVNQTDALTAAHPSLPFGTKVQVDNLGNGRSVVVRVNDRASFARGRVILVSRAAAEQLDMIRDGRANVRVSLVDGDRPGAGSCGDSSEIAEEPAAPEPAADETTVASDPADIEEVAATEPAPAQSEPAPVEESGPADPAAVSDESLADRFAAAFQPQTWQEAELAKVLAACVPRLAAPPRRIPIPWPALDRMTPIRLTPVLIAYAWSSALSLRDPAGFSPPATPIRLSQLMQ